jgi:kexin
MEENSINVTGVWDEGVFGKGVNVAIVDDGLDMHSDDLAANFVSTVSLLFEKSIF